MDTSNVFEESKRINSEIKEAYILISKLSSKLYKLTTTCNHEIVFKYKDFFPKRVITDGIYYCPACEKRMELKLESDIKKTDFKYSRIIPITNISIFGNKETLDTIRNEVYANMDIYYNKNVKTEILSNKMEKELIAASCNHKDIPSSILRR